MDLERARQLAFASSVRYMGSVGMHLPASNGFSEPVSLYLSNAFRCLPLKTLVVAERPYASNIHGRVSSALSYDSSLCVSTPSVVGAALDVSHATKTTFVSASRWFSEGWRYIDRGVMLVNCMHTRSFSESSSSLDTVPFQRFVRDIIILSALVSSEKITIVCMGVPASVTMNAVAQNLGKFREKVSVLRYSNPAVFGHMAEGDKRSPKFTFGYPGTSKALAAAIERCLSLPPATVQSYRDSYISAMSNVQASIDDVVSASSTLVTEIEDAFKELELKREPPSLRSAHEAFVSSLYSFRDRVVMDVIQHSLDKAVDDNGKLGKPTAWGTKRGFVNAASSVGQSSKMSVVTGTEPAEIPLFASDDPPSSAVPAFASAAEIPLQMPEEETTAPVQRIKTKGAKKVALPKSMEFTESRRAVIDAVSYAITNKSVAPAELESAVLACAEQTETTDPVIIRILYYASKDSEKGKHIADALGLKGEPQLAGSVLAKYLKSVGVKLWSD